MLDESNCQGYVTTPIIEAFQQRRVFKLLDLHEFRKRAWLIRQLKANPGYFTIALESLVSLGWLERDMHDAYRLTARADGNHCFNLTSLYAIGPEQLIESGPHARWFAEKIQQVFLNSKSEAAASSHPNQGAILVPLVLVLQGVNPERFSEDVRLCAPTLSPVVIELFFLQGWLTEKGQLTASGKELLENKIFQEVASCRSILHEIDHLMFGDPAQVLSHGLHQEQLITPKNFTEENLIADLKHELVRIFNKESSQKLAARGVQLICGYSALSNDISGKIGSITASGRNVPISQAADNAQTDQETLLLRIFADHSITPQTNALVNPALSILACGQPAHYLDQQGGLTDAVTVLSCWQQHLRELARTLNDSPLLIVEAHTLSSCFPDQNANDCGRPDWIYRLAKKHLISADAFITLAASVGLFNDGRARRYPQTHDPCRVSFHSLIRRDYLVRHAMDADLERLCELEALCWQHTRTSKNQIRSRLRQYPQGQFVLEKDGKVLGVIYSQRISSIDALAGRKAADIQKLHQDSGPVVQLLAVNIDPHTQNAGYGDQLLEFMLQRCSLMAGVKQVVGVTLCKNYDSAGSQSFADYIQQQGSGQDPILAFHHAHGATIVRAVPGYRPQDHANLSNGVLVAYDLLNRTPRHPWGEAGKNPVINSERVSVRINQQEISAFVQKEAAQLLGVSSGELDIDRPVMEMGLDSADLLKLQRQLEQKFHLELQAGFFFEHSTIHKVINHLTARFAQAPEAGSASLVTQIDQSLASTDAMPTNSEKQAENHSASTDIAIVGISCKLPGGIESPGQLWQALASKKCVISSFPRERRSWPSDVDKPAIDQGGFVKDVEAFDAEFFRMSRAEAEITDPQQRMLLELAWACLEDAGILPEALKGSKTGVFVGASNCDYSRLVQEAGLEVEAHHGVGNSLAVLANRLSYFFDLSGPSLVIDTACSSSLVALHEAIQSLHSGECATAFVGGVNLICHPDLSIAYHKAGMLSPDGRCKVFDATANGYVRSEGAVMLLLKPLSAAVAAGDQIHAVIKGSATNHGGLAGGLTVPNPQQQSELLLAAWKNAGIAPEDLSYIEAHGTGTSLGDPIEIQGVQAAFSRQNSLKEGKTCSIGSVKSNLGHLESAAGITGLLKVVLSLQHQQLPATINFTRLNPKIHLQDTPFYIQDQHTGWQAKGRRLAAVSSFGSGGANAHVVVQEYLPCPTIHGAEQDYLFVLSAPRPDRLRDYAAQVVSWLESDECAPDFRGAIYTWQVGRTAMKHRLAIRVVSQAHLLEKLKLFLAGNTDVAEMWSSQTNPVDSNISRMWETRSGRQLIEQLLFQKDLEQLGILWTSGIEINWNKLYEGPGPAANKPQRISLPTYAFARERYWIETAEDRPVAANGASQSASGVAALHPLLHHNASDLNSQRYTSTFTGMEFFLADHQMATNGHGAQKLFPGVAYLEMARAAIEQAWTERPESALLELRDIVWTKPIVVNQNRQISITLFANDRDEVDCEISSRDGSQEIVHCQGRGAWSRQRSTGRLDLDQLKSGRKSLGSDKIYEAFTKMGLHYGPAHQGITALYFGEKQLLAHLRLPEVVAKSQDRYVLHPSLMDGALQAALALLVDLSGPPARAPLPFALGTLRITSACKKEMFAWVRHAPGSQLTDKVVKVDIDLCDEHGNICVQMLGFSARAMSPHISRVVAQAGAASTLVATPIWRASDAEAFSAVVKHEDREHHVILCELEAASTAKLEPLLPYSHCLPLRAEQQKDIAQRYSQYALACFERIQAILRSKPQDKVLVQVVVAGHQEQALFAGLSGLLKTAALENPQLAGQLLLIHPEISAEELATLLEKEKSGSLEAVVQYAPQAQRRILSWQPAAEPQDQTPIAFKEKGVYLITGGLGNLGMLFAKEILTQTQQARVVLTGRSALNAEKQARLEALSSQSGRVSYRKVDLADLDAVRQLIAQIRAGYGQLNGILHTAGMIADHFILKKNSAEFSEVLGPKVTGTYNLDEASKDIALDFFVLFSSVAGALGNVGQADYAAANGFMDQFAAYRNRQAENQHRQGLTRAINWGLWQAGGMGVDAATQELLQQSIGTQPMQTAIGLQAFHRSLALPCDQILVAAGDVSQLQRIVLKTSPAVEQQEYQSGIASAFSSEDLVWKTQDYLRKQLSGVLKLPVQKIDPQAALENYGIDSILATKLTNELEKTFGPLSKTLFFEYQNIGELTRYFIQFHSAHLGKLFVKANASNTQIKDVAARPSPQPDSSVRVTPSRRFSRQGQFGCNSFIQSEPIAIVGLSGRYPEALDIDAYWRNLRDGKDCIVEVPNERWDWREYFSEDRTQNGHHFSKWGGFIGRVDEFDPLFFNIAPKDARYIDPQERLFLQHAWMAIEDAGYTRVGLQVPCENDLPGQVGVYVGVMYSEYQLFGARVNAHDLRMGFAGITSSIANRVSYALNLHGPSMTLDTMCSSSLSAIHIACQDLKQGRTSMAIAGGVNVSIHPSKYLMLSAGQFISSDGHCQSFGEGGDGYIPGEGVGVVVLKRLSEAERDGDHIYGIIRGSALTHGGKTNGYTVPNPQAQASAINRALAEAHVDACHISYIEAHGTGTRLGDPIEIAALSKAFQQYTQETGFCQIGSAKSNIGHCESAAGIAGLTKVMLQMQHRQIVPSLHSEQLNPNIDFSRTPFVVNQRLRPWEQPVVDGRKLRRIAGISSFGAGGSNAHMIVEEYEAPARVPLALEKLVVVLSARTAEQLKQKASDLLGYVRERQSDLDLAAVAYTLQVGREAMEERLGLVVSSVEQLVERLQAWLQGEQAIDGLHQGQMKGNREVLAVFSGDGDMQQTIEKWVAHGKLSKLLELWVKGLEVDWNTLYEENRPQRISLPAYPFARDRYWIDAVANVQLSASNALPSRLHPLLHRNTSDMTHQGYTSTFSGEEFFLKDHQVNAEKTVPVAAYLEMARAAFEKAVPNSQSSILEICDVAWAEPLVASHNREVSITLLANENDEVDFEIFSQGAEQVVHCQGRALWNGGLAPIKLDTQQLQAQMTRDSLDAGSIYASCARIGLVYGPTLQAISAIHRGDNQGLAQLRLPPAAEQRWEDYVLHPALIESALQAGAELIEGSSSRPFALERLRVLSACSPEMFAWIRYASGSPKEDQVKLDIDLCDEHGNVCVQMGGVSWQTIGPETIEPVESVIEQEFSPAVPVSAEGVVPMPLLRKEITLRAEPQAVTASKIPQLVAQKKATGITLAGSKSVALPGKPERSKSLINLSSPRVQTSEQPMERTASSVRLFDCGYGIFSIQVEAGHAYSREIIAGLLHALNRVQQEAPLKVLMLSSLEHCFVHSGRASYNEAVTQGLYAALALFPCPVIAVLNGATSGPGLLAAALCDFMVCSEEALYSYTDAPQRFYPCAAELKLLSARFGAAQAQDLLYQSVAATGRQLRDKGWTCPIVAGDQATARAEELAVSLAGKSQKALRLLKQHLTRELVPLAKELRQAENTAPVAQETSAGVAAELVSPVGHIHLEDPVENVVVIRFGVGQPKLAAKEIVTDLGRALIQLKQAGCAKAVVLASEYPGFLPDPASTLDEDILQDLQRTILKAEVPVIAALAGHARGTAWLISQFCDGCIYSQTGEYSSAGIGHNTSLLPMAAAWFSHRVGDAAAIEILLSGAVYSGTGLQERAGALLIAEQKQVLLAAIIMAEFWARLPQAVLADWKRHSATVIAERMQRSATPAVGEEHGEVPTQTTAASVSIPLQSKVVTVTAHAEGIVVVKMEDRQARNMFSDDLVAGVTEAFAHIEQTSEYKVVVLTGYDSYFSSGGSLENLLDVQAGKKKFTDFQIFQSALKCKLPVIAAIQGHGIGVGWALGMCADVVLLSEESRYLSPYMNYGFTPGGGATCILAEKMGQDLARESLLTGQPFTGRELKQRGLRLAVLPRKEVYKSAMELARQIVPSSRSRLIKLKQQLSARIQQEIEEICRLELAMHEHTLVGQADALAKIQKSFAQKQASAAAIPVKTVSLQSPVTAAASVATATAEVTTASPQTDSDLLPVVTASLRKLLANELQLQESDVDENAQFVDLGLDSISGVTWIRKINEKYHTSIEATKVYNYPTLSQLSRHVKAEAERQGTLSKPVASVTVAMAVEVPVLPDKVTTPRQQATQSRVVKHSNGAATKLTSWRNRKHARFTANATTAPAAHTQTQARAIAVIGMAGQFPQARNLEEFWQNIAQGKNCISRIPSDRWDVNTYYQPGEAAAGKSNSQWVGALEEYDCFDPLFFNISPTEAESMDPQQRLFLQACWHSIENAGYDARRLSGSRCGVFAGCTAGDYHQLWRQHQLSAQGFTGNATSILAARISYFLNLQGPCISTDTACSSSLVAIAQACDSLIVGSSDLALAGGVYVMAGPEMHIKASQAGMLSPEGKCFTFDQRADGFVPGEGVGVVLLKRLADAERDQDIIYGVIEGWGVNQDGKTNGITAPNPESQTRLEQEVYDKYGIDPGSIQLVEAHGTGTKLGDPIEVEGLKKAFAKYTQKQEYCALGSVKSNVGHCATAAGVAGFLKLVLALQHKQLPPTINFERLNEHIDLKDSPFYVNSRLQEWERRGAEKRQAAVSSFGFSGTNAHVVVGEYSAATAVKAQVSVVQQNGKIVVPLSATTAVQLKQKARDLRDFLVRQKQPVDLVEVAYTLQVGREAMDDRAGFLAGSVEELTDKLSAYIEDKLDIKDFYQGQVKRNRESVSIISQDDEVKETIINKWIAAGKVSGLLEFWVKGLEVDWKKLYGEKKPRRIALPVYPFAKERYWIAPETAMGRDNVKGNAIAVLHPLLHSNTSDFNEQRYNSTFTGEESFLTDHQVRSDGHSLHKVLPGVAYLEMARAAIEQAWPGHPQDAVLELRNTLWLKPLIVAQQKQVSTVLLADDSEPIGYEISGIEDGQKTIHCQGEAVFVHQAAPARLEIRQIKAQMQQGRLKASDVYAICAAMGLGYGPAHQGITAIHLGEKQVLAELHLPPVAAASQRDYVLHPSLMDSAFQASIGLIAGNGCVPDNPFLPFVLGSIRILSPCTTEMVAWVRLLKDSKLEDKTIKLDIDLCDLSGRVCIYLQGLALRALQNAAKTAQQKQGSILHQAKDNSLFDPVFYQKMIESVLKHEVSADQAAELA